MGLDVVQHPGEGERQEGVGTVTAVAAAWRRGPGGAPIGHATTSSQSPRPRLPAAEVSRTAGPGACGARRAWLGEGCSQRLRGESGRWARPVPARLFRAASASRSGPAGWGNPPSPPLPETGAPPQTPDAPAPGNQGSAQSTCE
ncbi:hypothetical protein GCM10010381_25450 [Streptomyces xantholiticus]|nr:hypothetical protein GCM10010381_25450 [Streptomyces xantholiticus]